MVKKNKVSVADKKKKLYNRIMDEKRITTDQTTIRINKYLSAAGVCSRREADQLTDAGRVTVAGKEIGTGERIPADAEVFLDGRPVKAETRQVLLLFYKPRGIVCSTKKQRQETTVTEFLDYPVRVYPVGRLDKDSEGLLLLTNQGDLVNRIMRGVLKADVSVGYRAGDRYETAQDKEQGCADADGNESFNGIVFHDSALLF